MTRASKQLEGNSCCLGGLSKGSSDRFGANTPLGSMPALQGHTRTAFLCFFISHIPITLIIDGQGLFSRHFYPECVRGLLDWYAITFNDKLMTAPHQPWFLSLILLEVFFQFPFFILAVYAILQSSKKNNGNDSPTLIRGDGVFRSLCLIYGSSTATTLMPIFASFLTDHGTTVGEKGVLLGFYLPYLIFPLWLVVIAVCEENVFGVKNASKID